MIPDDCALAIADGVVAVVDEFGDVRDSHGENGIYTSDVQYLREFAVRPTDRDEPTTGWDRIARRAGPDGVTTVLASGAVGDGRGDARPLLLEKRLVPDASGVTLTTTVENYTTDRRTVDVEVTARSSFRHVFECPGFFAPREPVDRTLDVRERPDGATLTADCPDETTRRATIDVTDAAAVATSTADDVGTTITATLPVPPGDTATITASATFAPARAPSDGRAAPGVSTQPSSPLFDAAADTLTALMLPDGVPAAGAPRFLAPFGRDALLVAFQTLPFVPQLTRRTIEYFAGQQGTTTDATTLEEPGKIPHETRHGDRPAVGKSIRAPYYGTVDATPLYAALVAAYGEWAGADAVTDGLYAAAVDAAEWICEASGPDGLLRYDPHDHEHGLAHLGWKDSSRALARPDGTPATPPIALAEVQGYAYRALCDVAELAASRGDDILHDRFAARADDVRDRFDEAFWLPDERCYALALDDDGVVESVASNQGHALWAGIAPDDRADAVIDRLLEPDMLTDAGIRTFAESHDAFDPLSYHRGSVWPHDTSFAAMGFARYGRDDAVATLVGRGLDALEASATTDPDRWGFPELMVGLDAPTLETGRVHHPDSCEPAAWSAGSAFGFVRAALGIGVRDGAPVAQPALPDRFEAVHATVRCHDVPYAVRCTDNSIVMAPTTDRTGSRGPMRSSRTTSGD
ncbi:MULTISPECIES: MGH1-like glycoside hydrolase domain-containing protein [Natrialbaceae]|uniref:MGH1-like glycoside hydrolase domain-containing protein n=1 Tax=Natrialbaceae TaxID=1644061 RepID=UPI00207D467C|nr:glycogen debranching N-terminal domain-containing protein [Natronococcus sp. CG52]